MSSILTNSAAMSALQTLRSINSQLDSTQSQISSGMRVQTAADNAAYWSIATTMKSDKTSMSAISDALGVGASVATAAYTGLDSTKDVLDSIKSKLVTATSDGVDKTKVQADITQLQDQLKTIASSSSFSGQNWLVGTGGTKDIVSSLGRDASGAITVGTIQFDTTSVVLMTDSTVATPTGGLLGTDIDIGGYSATTLNPATVDVAGGGTSVQFANAGDQVSFSVSVNGAPATSVNITQSTLASAGLTGSTIQSYSDLGKVLNQALSDANINDVTASIDTTTGAVSFNSDNNLTVSYASSTDGAGGAGPSVTALGLNASTDGDVTGTNSSAANTVSGGVMAISLTTTTTSAQVQVYLKAVDQALTAVTTAASNVGSIQNRISTQSDFVSTLMDNIDKGVGTLVDADMNEESTKLKALQTQQQLGIQALSIANSSSQNILSLFR